MVSLEQFKNIPSVYLMQANVCTVTYEVKNDKFKRKFIETDKRRSYNEDNPARKH